MQKPWGAVLKQLDDFLTDLSLAMDRSPFPVAVWYEAGVLLSARLTDADKSNNQQMGQKLYSWIRERWVVLPDEDKERHFAKIELARSEHAGNAYESALELLKSLGFFDLDLSSPVNWPTYPKRGNAQLERAFAAGIERNLAERIGINNLEQIHHQMEIDAFKKLRDDSMKVESEIEEFIAAIESKLEKFTGDNSKELEEIVKLFINLFEADEYEFVVFLEDYLDNHNMSQQYHLSNTVLSHLDANPEFVGTYFALLSGADLIDPNSMRKVMAIDSYPFGSDSDTFNNSKCPASSVAMSIEAPIDILEELSKSQEVGVRYRVALNPNANEQCLINLIDFALKQESNQVDMLNEYIFATVAFHRNVTPKVIDVLENSTYPSTRDVLELRNKSDSISILCKKLNTDCIKLSAKNVLGNSLLWWELTNLSWAKPGLYCAQDSECKLGFFGPSVQ